MQFMIVEIAVLPLPAAGPADPVHLRKSEQTVKYRKAGSPDNGHIQRLMDIHGKEDADILIRKEALKGAEAFDLVAFVGFEGEDDVSVDRVAASVEDGSGHVVAHGLVSVAVAGDHEHEVALVEAKLLRQLVKRGGETDDLDSAFCSYPR